jgi:Zn-dependent protease with chaperone function
MPNKIRVRPTRAVTVMGLVAAAAMLIFGIFFLGAVLKDTGGEPGPAIAFMIVWFVVLGIIIAFGIYNLTSRKGVIEFEAGPEDAGLTAGPDFDEKLRKLEALKKDGLVTDEEYRAKRHEIMSEKW